MPPAALLPSKFNVVVYLIHLHLKHEHSIIIAAPIGTNFRILLCNDDVSRGLFVVESDVFNPVRATEKH